MSFISSITEAWEKNNSLVCIGLDPELSRLPAAVRDEKFPIFAFNKAIIDATADIACVYKPQIAHYAAERAEDQLLQTIEYIHRNYPLIPVILDSKRGDIGNTAKQYAREAFERYGADALTVSPYLGFDSLEPYLEFKDKGVFVLVRTSNPGAKDLQDLETHGRKLYQVVAELALTTWNVHGNVMLVVGATYPEELATIRAMSDSAIILVPGVGAQGGDVQAVVTNAMSKDRNGLLISSSRGILYASSGPDFAEAARTAAIQLRDEINQYR